jgi:hypothetical protein
MGNLLGDGLLSRLQKTSTPSEKKGGSLRSDHDLVRALCDRFALQPFDGFPIC